MISVLTSYRVGSGSGILPELEVVCQELYSRGFLGIDVLLTRADLEHAYGNRGLFEINGLLDAAERIESRIRKCIELPEASGVVVPLQVCALATNFSAISSVSEDTTAWKTAVEYLAVCLVVAHRLGTRAVEVVCGSRVHAQNFDGRLFVTSLDNMTVIDKIRKRCAEGLYRALCRANEALKLGPWPEVGLAVEMEPDVIALVRDLEDVNLLLVDVDRLIIADHPKRFDQYTLRRHFGVNMDWGHVLLAADRNRDPSASVTLSPDAAAKKCVTQIRKLRLRNRIMHAHVSDHYPGAHRADSSIGDFRPLDAYLPFLKLHAEILRDFERSKRSAISQFFSAAMAIELEACQDPGLAVKCRERLYVLKERACRVYGDNALDIETEKDRLRQVEQRVGRAGKAEGWLQGINRTIYDALSDLHRCTEPKASALVDEKMLVQIRAFLSAQEPDTRTKRAVDLAYSVFHNLGAEILIYWLSDLLDEEWGHSFFPKYRDHTVHSVYVYLLGLYLYASSPEVRRIVHDEDSVPAGVRYVRPTLLKSDGQPGFFSKWALASLTHDIGYPFEAGGPALDKARRKLLQTIWRFVPHIAALASELADVNRDKTNVPDYASANKELLKAIGGTKKILGELDPLGDLFFLDHEQEPNIQERRLAAANSFDDFVNTNDAEKFIGATTVSIMQIFDLYRRNEPNHEDTKGRSTFLDHGFMSAAVLKVLLDACQWWHSNSRDTLAFLSKCDPAVFPKAKLMRDSLRGWKENFWATTQNAKAGEFIEDVLFSIMIHNIAPERGFPEPGFPDGTKGLMYHKDSSDPVILFLQGHEPNYADLPLLPFLLGLCDNLHEWHRFGFVNPLKLAHSTLSALEVEASPTTLADGSAGLGFTYNTSAKVGKNDMSFGNFKKAELTRKFGRYWEKFIAIEMPVAGS